MRAKTLPSFDLHPRLRRFFSAPISEINWELRFKPDKETMDAFSLGQLDMEIAIRQRTAAYCPIYCILHYIQYTVCIYTVHRAANNIVDKFSDLYADTDISTSAFVPRIPIDESAIAFIFHSGKSLSPPPPLWYASLFRHLHQPKMKMKNRIGS